MRCRLADLAAPTLGRIRPFPEQRDYNETVLTPLSFDKLHCGTIRSVRLGAEEFRLRIGETVYVQTRFEFAQ